MLKSSLNKKMLFIFFFFLSFFALNINIENNELNFENIILAEEELTAEEFAEYGVVDKIIAAPGIFTRSMGYLGGDCETLADLAKEQRNETHETNLNGEVGMNDDMPDTGNNSRTNRAMAGFGEGLVSGLYDLEDAEQEPEDRSDKGLMGINCGGLGAFNWFLRIYEPVNITTTDTVMGLVNAVQIIAFAVGFVLIVIYGIYFTFGKHGINPINFLIRTFVVLLVVYYLPYLAQDILNLNNVFIYYMATEEFELLGGDTSVLLGTGLSGLAIAVMATMAAVIGKMAMIFISGSFIPFMKLFGVMLFIIIIGFFIKVILTLVMWWYMRMFMIFFLVVVGPIFMVFMVLPNTAGYATKWIKFFAAEVFTQAGMVLATFFVVGILKSPGSILGPADGLNFPGYAFGYIVLTYAGFTFLSRVPDLIKKWIGADAGGLGFGDAQKVASSVSSVAMAAMEQGKKGMKINREKQKLQNAADNEGDKNKENADSGLEKGKNVGLEGNKDKQIEALKKQQKEQLGKTAENAGEKELFDKMLSESNSELDKAINDYDEEMKRINGDNNLSDKEKKDAKAKAESKLLDNLNKIVDKQGKNPAEKTAFVGNLADKIQEQQEAKAKAEENAQKDAEEIKNDLRDKDIAKEFNGSVGEALEEQQKSLEEEGVEGLSEVSEDKKNDIKNKAQKAKEANDALNVNSNDNKKALKNKLKNAGINIDDEKLEKLAQSVSEVKKADEAAKTAGEELKEAETEHTSALRQHDNANTPKEKDEAFDRLNNANEKLTEAQDKVEKAKQQQSIANANKDALLGDNSKLMEDKNFVNNAKNLTDDVNKAKEAKEDFENSLNSNGLSISEDRIDNALNKLSESNKISKASSDNVFASDLAKEISKGNLKMEDAKGKLSDHFSSELGLEKTQADNLANSIMEGFVQKGNDISNLVEGNLNKNMSDAAMVNQSKDKAKNTVNDMVGQISNSAIQKIGLNSGKESVVSEAIQTYKNSGEESAKMTLEKGYQKLASEGKIDQSKISDMVTTDMNAINDSIGEVSSNVANQMGISNTNVGEIGQQITSNNGSVAETIASSFKSGNSDNLTSTMGDLYHKNMSDAAMVNQSKDKANNTVNDMVGQISNSAMQKIGLNSGKESVVSEAIQTYKNSGEGAAKMALENGYQKLASEGKIDQSKISDMVTTDMNAINDSIGEISSNVANQMGISNTNVGEIGQQITSNNGSVAETIASSFKSGNSDNLTSTVGDLYQLQGAESSAKGALIQSKVNQVGKEQSQNIISNATSSAIQTLSSDSALNFTQSDSNDVVGNAISKIQSGDTQGAKEVLTNAYGSNGEGFGSEVAQSKAGEAFEVLKGSLETSTGDSLQNVASELGIQNFDASTQASQIVSGLENGGNLQDSISSFVGSQVEATGVEDLKTEGISTFAFDNEVANASYESQATTMQAFSKAFESSSSSWEQVTPAIESQLKENLSSGRMERDNAVDNLARDMFGVGEGVEVTAEQTQKADEVIRDIEEATGVGWNAHRAINEARERLDLTPEMLDTILADDAVYRKGYNVKKAEDRAKIYKHVQYAKENNDYKNIINSNMGRSIREQREWEIAKQNKFSSASHGKNKFDFSIDLRQIEGERKKFRYDRNSFSAGRVKSENEDENGNNKPKK